MQGDLLGVFMDPCTIQEAAEALGVRVWEIRHPVVVLADRGLLRRGQRGSRNTYVLTREGHQHLDALEFQINGVENVNKPVLITR